MYTCPECADTGVVFACECKDVDCPEKCFYENEMPNISFWWKNDYRKSPKGKEIHFLCKTRGIMNDRDERVHVHCECAIGDDKMKECASPNESYCDNCGDPIWHVKGTTCSSCGEVI